VGAAFRMRCVVVSFRFSSFHPAWVNNGASFSSERVLVALEELFGIAKSEILTSRANQT